MSSVSTAFQSGGWAFELALQARTARGGQVEARLRGLRIEPPSNPVPRAVTSAGVASGAALIAVSREDGGDPAVTIVPSVSESPIYSRRNPGGPLRLLREARRLGSVVDTFA